MSSSRSEQSTVKACEKKSLKKTTFNFRILLLGILAGFLPLFITVFAVRVASPSLQQEIPHSLADLGNQEGKRLDMQQRTLIFSQIRQKALDVAEDVAKYIKHLPPGSIATLIKDHDFRTIAVQPVGLVGETFLLDPQTQRILLHSRKDFESQNLKDVFAFLD